jgi:molecular chaperone GrpE
MQAAGRCARATRSYFGCMLFPRHFDDPYSPLGRLSLRRPRRWAVPEIEREYATEPEVASAVGSEPRRVPVRAPGDPESLGVPPPVDAAPPSPPEPDTAAADAAAGDDARDAAQRLHDAARDLEAARRRVERDAQRTKEEMQAQLVAKLLPLLDNLDRAVAANSDQNALREGVGLMRAQLEQILADYGVERIDSVGQRFDPTLHEALDVVPVDVQSEDGTVVRQWDAGYRFAGRVLRAAKVAVGRLR